MKLYDAHNHLQDSRLTPYRSELLAAMSAEGITYAVVNGTSETDWATVLDLADQSAMVIPSLGLHPWFVPARQDGWEDRLRDHLVQRPCALGEIGLDRWKPGLPYEDQEDVFLHQFALAAELNLPASIHCLKAWDRLLPMLRGVDRPRCGFLLHSWGGPPDQIEKWVELGAYFSFPGYYAHPRKERTRNAFRNIPFTRMLVETDAPDQPLPDERMIFRLPPGQDGKPVHHPANLPVIYRVLADTLSREVAQVAEQVEQNFHRLFGGVIPLANTIR